MRSQVLHPSRVRREGRQRRGPPADLSFFMNAKSAFPKYVILRERMPFSKLQRSFFRGLLCLHELSCLVCAMSESPFINNVSLVGLTTSLSYLSWELPTLFPESCTPGRVLSCVYHLLCVSSVSSVSPFSVSHQFHVCHLVCVCRLFSVRIFLLVSFALCVYLSRGSHLFVTIFPDSRDARSRWWLDRRSRKGKEVVGPSTEMTGRPHGGGATKRPLGTVQVSDHWSLLDAGDAVLPSGGQVPGEKSGGRERETGSADR